MLLSLNFRSLNINVLEQALGKERGPLYYFNLVFGLRATPSIAQELLLVLLKGTYWARMEPRIPACKTRVLSGSQNPVVSRVMVRETEPGVREIAQQ